MKTFVHSVPRHGYLFAFVIAAALPLAAVDLTVDPVVLTFDALGPGERLHAQYERAGVTFSSAGAELLVFPAVPSDRPSARSRFSAPNSVLPWPSWQAGFTTARFSIPVEAVSVVVGDNGGGTGHLFLGAYDREERLVASAHAVLDPGHAARGKRLRVAARGIALVKFGEVLPQPARDGEPTPSASGNSVLFDNFAFEPARPSPVMPRTAG